MTGVPLAWFVRSSLEIEKKTALARINFAAGNSHLWLNTFQKFEQESFSP